MTQHDPLNIATASAPPRLSGPDLGDLGINTGPEPLAASEKKARAAMLGATGLAVVPHRGVFGFFKKLTKGVTGKIAMGVLCAMIAGFIKDMPALWHGVRVVFSFIGTLGDHKATATIRRVIDQGGEVVRQQAAPDEEGKPRPTLKERAKGLANKAKQATKEAVEETTGKIEEKSKPLAQKAERAFDNLAGQPQQMSQQAPPNLYQPPQNINPNQFRPPPGVYPPPPTLLDRAGNGMKGIGDGISSFARAKAKQQEEQDRARARFLGVQFDDKTTIEKIRADLQIAEMKYQKEHGPNAQCPNCHFPMRLSTTRTKDVMCPNFRCKLQFNPKTGLFLGPPKRRP